MSEPETPAPDIQGTWHLVAWRRLESDGTIIFPLGPDADGTLVYAPDGGMAVVLTAVPRGSTESTDPLGGDAGKRAQAYSTCLAYAGTYEVTGDTVVHDVRQALFPGWANSAQQRPITFDGDDNLVLRTPPQPDGTVNEIVWSRQPRG